METAVLKRGSVSPGMMRRRDAPVSFTVVIGDDTDACNRTWARVEVLLRDTALALHFT